jgi:hypothetical protein
MRRPLSVIAVALALLACGPSVVQSPPATSSLALASPTPTPTPTLTPTPTPSLLPTAPPEPPQSQLPEVEVPLDEIPTFPMPLLLDGTQGRPAMGSTGCPTIYYELPNDPYYRSGQYVPPTCPSVVITLGQPIEVAGGGELHFQAQAGWSMGAQVIRGTTVLWVVRGSPLEHAAPGVRMIDAGATGPNVELASGDGFNELDLYALGPPDAGDYLVTLEAQMGQLSREWRTSGLTYYWWIRVR